jgi:hypothetical protein
VTDELTKALLLEEVASEEAIAEALLASVTGGVPLVHALTDSRAVTPDLLARYLARTEAPYLREVAPIAEIVERLPPGLCARLLALPVRRDAITGTVDIVVADASDPHPAKEIAFHLGVPVRLVRASIPSIEEALRRLRSHSLLPGPHAPAPRPEVADPRDGERMYDSRSRPSSPGAFRGATLPPAAPGLRSSPSQAMRNSLSSEALRPSHVPGSERQAHVVGAAPQPKRRPAVTPPWGTLVPDARSSLTVEPSEPPESAFGSEIPIPLTRRTHAAVTGGTQRPPALVEPKDALGKGYDVDASHFRQIVEINERSRNPGMPLVSRAPAVPSFIPAPAPLPGAGAFNAYAAQVPFAEIGGLLAAMRAAGSRDEVLELVLTGARMVAFKVALFVVKRGRYLGWACTPEFGDRASLQTISVPLESSSVFGAAVRDGLYLGPVRHDDVHAALLHVMRGASRDVAVVPVRVRGKTAVIVLADEIGDTMLATRRLEELAQAAGEAFGRIVAMRR